MAFETVNCLYMWQAYTCMYNRRFFLNFFPKILYLGSLFQIAFLNGKSLKNLRLLIFYQAIYTCQNWSITDLPIDGLHIFSRNCLTTFLLTYSINEKYLSYMIVTFCYYYCLFKPCWYIP